MRTHEKKLKLSLHPIDKKLALRLVRDIHQSSDTLPSTTNLCLGVYIDNNLEGVITFGHGTRPLHTIRKLFPSLTSKDYWEIGRMCVNEEFKTNTESQMLSKAVKYVKKNYPSIKLLFTWANGLDGKIGTVYQASNFLYGGYIETEAYFYKGIKIHPRGMKKLLSPNDKRRSVRPTAEQKIRYGIDQVKGKQFRYIYFTCGFSEKKRLLEESPFKWSTDYPSLADCTWKKWVAPRKYVKCEKPFVSSDESDILKRGRSNLDNYFEK